MSAIDLYNKPSDDFDTKVASSIALLQRAAAEYPTLTQASSLGAEDIVVTHLIHLAGIQSGVFVRYTRSVEVYRPKN
jgi:phosphoadenosine phosphosulfate reductase